jgi:hypothetical protein
VAGAHDWDALIARVRERALDPKTRFDAIANGRKPRDLLARAAPTQVLQAETELGFALPALLQRLYLEVADGGFGPAYSIFGLVTPGRFNRYTYTHDLLAEVYKDLCRLVITPAREPAWPFGMLPLCELGGGGFSCIDCSAADAPVWLFGLDQDGMGDSIDPDAFEELPEEELEQLTYSARARAQPAPVGTRLFEFQQQAPSLEAWLEGWVKGDCRTANLVW